MQVNVNPYQPPAAKLEDQVVPEDHALAGRGQRLGAALLDTVFGLIIGIPLMLALGTWDYLRSGEKPPYTLTLAGAALGFLGFLLIHGYFLKTSGQTIGKKLLGIRIADMDNNIPPFAKIIGLRYLPIQAAGVIPIVGIFYPLIDVLFIFSESRRCIHDLIAGTKVVKAK
jgi:uncharacterized RDD family membrane protein YckC